MWKHCIVCSSDLGTNPEVEAFPIGRRLVFDAERGRLWVVCPRCSRWNLTPVEERWEAVESLERLWRGASARVQGESLGMARLPSGMWIVRVGRDPSGDELAVWRWGRRGRVRRIAGPVAFGAAAVAGASAAAITLPATTVLPIVGVTVYMGYMSLLARNLGAVATTERAGDPTSLRRHEFLRAGMNPCDDELGWSIHLERPLTKLERKPILGIQGMPLVTTRSAMAERRWVEFTGADAVRIARRAFPMLNRRHSRDAVVTDAVDLVRAHGGAERYLRAAAGMKPRWVPFRQYPEAMRLSLEMVLFQEEERRALEGELGRLEAAWEEAEQLAAISDDLLPPPGWERFRRRVLGS